MKLQEIRKKTMYFSWKQIKAIGSEPCVFNEKHLRIQVTKWKIKVFLRVKFMLILKDLYPPATRLMYIR